MNKQKKYTFHTFLCDLLQTIGILIPIMGIYLYGKFELLWYQFAIAAFVIIFLGVVFSSYYPGLKGLDTNGQFLTLITSSIGSYFMKPFTHRIILWIIVSIFATGLFQPLKNHDKKNVVRLEQANAGIHLIFAFSFMYYAVKTPGLMRWINIFFMFVASVQFYIEQNSLEGIKEYDKQEDRFNASDFKKATNKSFDEVISDPGSSAEYATSTWFNDIESHHQVLFNVFTPSYDNRFVSEIDAIIIAENGINVIEIKNQSKYWAIRGEGKDDVKVLDQYGNLLDGPQQNPFHQNKIHQENLIHLLQQKMPATSKNFVPYVNGYVVFGERTLGVDISDNVTQGAASYTLIGKLINESCKKNHHFSQRRIDWLYMHLKTYENNAKLKEEHHRTLGY